MNSHETENMLTRLSRLVAIPSISRQEAAIADVVAAELSAAGLNVHRKDANVWCEVGDATRPRLLLNSHLDTVPPGEGWSADPWTPRVTNGRLAGLGANDAKGCVTAMIEAVLQLDADTQRGAALKGTVILALTAEEEISGQGLATILEELHPIDAAIVGEPTSLVPMIAQRGLLIVRGVAQGRTAHPANTPPDNANNAIMNAAEDLMRLRDVDFGPAHSLLGRTHAHVTMLNGGVARNVIPDRCEFCIDIRTTPVQSHRETLELLRRHLRSELHIHSERLVPVETDLESDIVQAVLRAVPGATPAGSPAMSDMVFLKGVPCVKIGPGDSARSHTPDEFITVDELNAGAAAYERIIREFSGPPTDPGARRR